jgi:hypothetical protein
MIAGRVTPEDLRLQCAAQTQDHCRRTDPVVIAVSARHLGTKQHTARGVRAAAGTDTKVAVKIMDRRGTDSTVRLFAMLR